MKQYQFLVIAAVVIMSCSGCVQHRQLVNFRNGDEAILDNYVSDLNLPVLRVQPDDILYITVNSLDDEASRPYNLAQSQAGRAGGGGAGGGGAGQQNQLLLQGYAVDSLGYIDFPNIGRLYVGNMTIEGVRQTIADALSPFLLNPAVNVKFLNFRYTIIGDIQLPGTYTTINERVSVLEALGTAGDLTPYANRNNILLIREEDNRRTVVRIDLQDRDFFASPYYYLQQNDVLYVEPTEAKVATVADPVNRFISYGSAFISVITLALTVFSR